MHVEADGAIVLDVLRVTTFADQREAYVDRDPQSGRLRLVGPAVEQMERTVATIEAIFHHAQAVSPITAVRREVLRYLLYRAGLQESHSTDAPWAWVTTLHSAFDNTVPVRVHGTIVHIHAEVPDACNR